MTHPLLAVNPRLYYCSFASPVAHEPYAALVAAQQVITPLLYPNPIVRETLVPRGVSLCS